ncbi:MAG: feruloyl-CoA synthase [Acidobacteriota bacterium]
MAPHGDARIRRARILTPDTVVRRDSHGVVYAHSPHALGSYPARLTDRLALWAERTPERPFLAERDSRGAWRSISYRETLRRVRWLSQSILDRNLSCERPIVILSGNSIEHGLLALAAMYSGVPYAPIAPAYSLLSREYATLRALWASLRPGLAFAADGAQFEPALAVVGGEAEIVTLSPAGALPTTSFADLQSRDATDAVDDAHARVGPDTIAKVLFTSGSTGNPKGVINTQRMLCANQEQIRTVMPLLSDEPPVLCDWLPWNHTFGGNHNFGIALYNGGTLYIDAGKPTAAHFHTTIANLRDVATTAYFNVPKGFELLAPALAADAAFRRHFFSRLQMLFYAAAGLRQQVADEFEALALDGCGERIPWVTGLGATESAPFAICTGARMSTTASIGVPAPGVELKAVPVGPVLEARLRGPNVTPGYWRDAALTGASFDEEGFYKLGDAIDFADRANPTGGFIFEGRIAEDFKLSTGTFVRVGPLRAALLVQLGDLVDDVVIAGHGRDTVCGLLFPNLAAMTALCGSAVVGASARQVLEHPAVRERLRQLLAEFAVIHPASSTCITRVALMEAAPSIDAQEITAKGSLNQRAVLAHRPAIVAQLYGSSGDAVIIDIC